MKYVTLMIFSLLSSSTSASATVPDSLTRRIDSLKSFLRDPDIEKRYAAEFGIAWELFDVDNPIAVRFAKRAYATALLRGDTSDIVRVGRIYGQLLRRVDLQDSAATILKSIIPFAERSRSNVELSKTLNALGVLYNVQARYDQSLIYHLSALRIRRQLNDSALIGASLQNIGLVYYKMSNYAQADSYYQEALEFRDHISRALLFLNIAILRVCQGEFSAAKQLAEEGLKLSQASSLKENTMYYNHIFGAFHSRRNRFDSAIYFYRKAISASAELGDIRMQLDGILGIAKCLTKMREYDSALRILTEGERMFAGRQHDLERLEYYDQRSKVLEAKALHRQALLYRNRHRDLNDSLFSQKVLSDILMARLQYEEVQNETTIAKQAEVLNLREAMIDRRNQLLLLSTVLAGLLLLIAILLYRFNRYQRQISVELDRKVFDRTRELTATENRLVRRLEQQRILQILISSKIRASVATIRGLWSIVIDGEYDRNVICTRFNTASTDLLQVSKLVDRASEDAFRESDQSMQPEPGLRQQYVQAKNRT